MLAPSSGTFDLRGHVADPLTVVIAPSIVAAPDPSFMRLPVRTGVDLLGTARILSPVALLTLRKSVCFGPEQLDLGLASAVRSAPSLRPSPRVDAVRRALAEEPARRWTLASAASVAGTSPHHLARLFKRATGHTFVGYLTSLRAVLALDPLLDGEGDLGRLAVDLGFVSHSHFTERFRQLLSSTPSMVRATLGCCARS